MAEMLISLLMSTFQWVDKKREKYALKHLLKPKEQTNSFS